MNEEQVSLRQSALWGAVAFGVALAVVIGVRLDQAALAVVVGVVCGVGASIPTALLIVALMRRRDGRHEVRSVGREAVQSPPVVVVAPPAAPQLPPAATWSGAYPTPAPAQRQFTVIGEEGTEDGFDYWQE
jgi:hypothetical protein